MAKMTDEDNNYDGLLGPDRADLYESINSLYQGSVQAACKGDSEDEKAYAHLMRRIAEKSVIRLTPSAKSTHCRRCDSVILDGIPALPPASRNARKLKKLQKKPSEVTGQSSVTMRIRKGRLVRSCRTCGLVRRVPMPYAPKIAKNHKRKAELKKKKKEKIVQ